jgi:hypothetical protein
MHVRCDEAISSSVWKVCCSTSSVYDLFYKLSWKIVIKPFTVPVLPYKQNDHLKYIPACFKIIYNY